MLTLYARDGWGSALIEAQLDWYGLPYRREEVGDLFESTEARAALSRVNPLAQIPTLVLPGGEVMTESAAITLYLADLTGSTDLVPARQEDRRPAFLRFAAEHRAAADALRVAPAAEVVTVDMFPADEGKAEPGGVDMLRIIAPRKHK